MSPVTSDMIWSAAHPRAALMAAIISLSVNPRRGDISQRPNAVFGQPRMGSRLCRCPDGGARRRAICAVRGGRCRHRVEKPVSCNVQLAPVSERGRSVMMLWKTANWRGRLDAVWSLNRLRVPRLHGLRCWPMKSRNPLAGIAAQLISMNARARDRELTDLIVAETRRIVKFFGAGSRNSAICARPNARRSISTTSLIARQICGGGVCCAYAHIGSI